MLRKNIYQLPINTDRCRNILGGIVLFSPRYSCNRLKAARSNPAPTNKPMTIDDRQGYVAPPHCNASSKQEMAAISNVAPRKSICFNLVIKGSCLSSFFKPLSRRKITLSIRLKAPKGRFLGESQCLGGVSTGSENSNPEAPSPTSI